jgi:hypothetical protein
MCLRSHHQPVNDLPPPSPSSRSSVLAPADLLVGALVPPVLIGLLAARAISQALTQAGLISEQLLQGQRLPNLNIPPTHPDG